MGLSEEDLYRELSADYRYHLAWRERLLAGFIIASATLAAGYYKADGYRWAVALGGFLFAVAIFLLEERCHEILLARRQAGVKLEEAVKSAHGFLQNAAEIGEHPHTVPHTWVLRFLYGGGAAAFFALFIWTVLVGPSSPVAGGARVISESLAALVLDRLFRIALLLTVLAFLGLALQPIKLLAKQLEKQADKPHPQVAGEAGGHVSIPKWPWLLAAAAIVIVAAVAIIGLGLPALNAPVK